MLELLTICFWRLEASAQWRGLSGFCGSYVSQLFLGGVSADGGWSGWAVHQKQWWNDELVGCKVLRSFGSVEELVPAEPIQAGKVGGEWNPSGYVFQ